MSNNQKKKREIPSAKSFLENLPAGMRGLTEEINSNNNEPVKETVSKKVELVNETITQKNSKQEIQKGEFDEVLSVFIEHPKGQTANVYVHPEVRELCLKIKTIPQYSKIDIKNIASAMIYGYFMEHKEEFLKKFEEAKSDLRRDMSFLD